MIEDAVHRLIDQGHEVLAAVMAGGTEKLPPGGVAAFGPAPVRGGGDHLVVLADAIAELSPDAVLDLSDEPVLGYRRRFQTASVALWLRVPYEGADFRLTPPPRPVVATKPTVAVIGTGKRTGKTAVAGFAARTLAASGRRPIVVAMGRGGPPEPDLIDGGRAALAPADLLALADEGRHAASDYVEDALLARVPTVGCRRCGGGLAGGVGFSNMVAGVEAANGIDGDLILLEGSGASQPPVHADVTCLVVPASIPVEHLEGYLGYYRVLIADFVMVTMAESPFAHPSQVSAVVSRIEAIMGLLGERQGGDRAPIVRTVFRPTPTGSVRGAKAFIATTAPEPAAQAIVDHLEEVHGCTVTGISHGLSDRVRLERDLSAMRADVLLCEVKAAGVDVATRRAIAEGMRVVFMDNQPVGVGGDDPAALVQAAAVMAGERFQRGSG